MGCKKERQRRDWFRRGEVETASRAFLQTRDCEEKEIILLTKIRKELKGKPWRLFICTRNT